MNFSEYIAILSGDTSLLEKSKLEKKIAVMESLRGAHYRDTSRAKWNLEGMVVKKDNTTVILEDLAGDEAHYKQVLRREKDDTKANPIQLNAVHTADPEAIGRYLIQLYRQSQPADGHYSEMPVGHLYGFDLFVKSHRQVLVTNELFPYENELYAQRPGSRIKYTYNGGAPNIDNPKLAARYFLQAIDRVSSLREKHAGELRLLEKEIPVLTQMVDRPFDKEQELKQMKTELASLERKIALKITETQMKQDGLLDDTPEKSKGKSKKPAEVVSMDAQQTKPLRRAR